MADGFNHRPGLLVKLLEAQWLTPRRVSLDEHYVLIAPALRRADEQMHGVESLILQHETAQRTSGSAQDTLQRFLVEFHSGEHMVCYDALEEMGLLPRLRQARAVV